MWARGGLSNEQARRQRKALRAEIAREHAKKERAKLEELREKIRAASARRQSAVRAIVERCRIERRKQTDAAKRTREQLRAEIEEQRGKARARCRACKAEARAAGLPDIELAEKEYRAERALQQELRHIEGWMRKRDKGTRTALERRQESDDEVRNAIPEEWVPLWEQVKRSIKATPNRSRLEAFTEYVEANPSDVLSVSQENADREIAKLIREERRLSRTMKKARPRRPTAEELAAIPF